MTFLVRLCLRFSNSTFASLVVHIDDTASDQQNGLSLWALYALVYVWTLGITRNGILGLSLFDFRQLMCSGHVFLKSLLCFALLSFAH
jgi:hypothetical protein